MSIDLAPIAGETELADPAQVGEWADALPEATAGKQTPPWCQYIARDAGSPVGLAGFKAPPDAQGWAEIAYLTFLPAQRRGVATRMTVRLEEIARDAGAIGLRAHTLPEQNASTKVLVANGFTHVGETVDPDDGEVWRWEKLLATEGERRP